jgi:hypothetical protein
MPQLNDLSRSLVALDQDSTIIAVVEMSQSSWLEATREFYGFINRAGTCGIRLVATIGPERHPVSPMNKRGETRPNLVKPIGPVRRRGSAQAALWSAKKLSGGSASSGVNRGSKRNRVPQ